MRNIFVTLAFSAFFAVSSALHAQNLDPTVEVTREYEGKLVEKHKPALKMSVPDTVTRFALDFDYSVFENPYKGSYDFDPYTLSMKPSAADSGERKFYLRAGLGYQLKPELDLVLSPDFEKDAFNMDVYATHRSFLGNYWKLSAEPSGNSDYEMVRMPKESTERTWPGYDILTKAGVDCRYDREGVAWGFGAGYYGLARKDLSGQASMNALDARMTVSTKPEEADGLRYDIAAGYRFAHDRVNRTSSLNEHLFDFDMTFGPVLKGKHKLDFGLGVEMASYADAFESAAGQVSITPQYVCNTSRTYVKLGLQAAKIIRGKETSGMFNAREQYVYPDMYFSFALLPQSMKFFVSARGGNRLDSYSAILERNHHLTYASAPGILDYTVERVRAAAGFDGRISSRFTYNLRGGYACYAHGLLDAVEMGGEPRASLRYAPYQKWYAAFDWMFMTPRLRLDGTVSYDRAWGDVFEEAYVDVAVLKPAALTGDVSVEYNWNRRLFFGADCSFATARRGGFGVLETPDLVKGSFLELPGYADLGVYAEYVTARRVSFWLRAGNLLNMTVQRNPLYAEKGVNFTFGICLNL